MTPASTREAVKGSVEFLHSQSATNDDVGLFFPGQPFVHLQPTPIEVVSRHLRYHSMAKLETSPGLS